MKHKYITLNAFLTNTNL